MSSLHAGQFTLCGKKDARDMAKVCTVCIVQLQCSLRQWKLAAEIDEGVLVL